MKGTAGQAPGFTVFVGGPIQHALIQQRFDARVQQTLAAVLSIVSEVADSVLSAHAAEEFGVLTPKMESAYIARRDFGWMQRCDAFVAVLPIQPDGAPYRTDGTFIEIGWATAFGKPAVLLVEGPSGNEQHSHLVRGMPAVADIVNFNLTELLRAPSQLREVLLQIRRRREPLNVALVGGS